MNKKLPYGQSNYEMIIKNGYLYVIYAYGNDDFTSELDVVIFK